MEILESKQIHTTTEKTNLEAEIIEQIFYIDEEMIDDIEHIRSEMKKGSSQWHRMFLLAFTHFFLLLNSITIHEIIKRAMTYPIAMSIF